MREIKSARRSIREDYTIRWPRRRRPAKWLRRRARVVANFAVPFRTVSLLANAKTIGESRWHRASHASESAQERDRREPCAKSGEHGTQHVEGPMHADENARPGERNR